MKTIQTKSSSKSIGATEFKARCLEILDTVSRKRTSIVISKRGKPVARLVPLDTDKPQLFGRMQGSATIAGDIVQSTGELWDAER